MSKRDRHARILEIIRRHRVGSQEGLREHLQALGVDVAQATLSRDIRELRLVKVPDAEGAAHYALPEERDGTPSLATLMPALFVSAEGVGNLLVVRTLKGGAQTVAAGIDAESWPEVLGTIAGDDTILLILREAEALPAIQGLLEGLTGDR
ncbi:MAG TPA: arginine repressor [Longimicrobiales bacterium]|nr:arginine repressor [Longimicrobiales bacterium]